MPRASPKGNPVVYVSETERYIEQHSETKRSTEHHSKTERCTKQQSETERSTEYYNHSVLNNTRSFGILNKKLNGVKQHRQTVV